MIFDEYCYRHTKSCWKESHVCRFAPLPWPHNLDASWIFEDKGLPGETDRSIVWHSLGPSTEPTMLHPWMMLTKRPPWWQYINTYNAQIGYVLNCNTIVQVDNGCQCFYCILNTCMTTQKEDRALQKRINYAIIRLLIKQEKACEVVLVKLKPHIQVKWKKYYEKKVSTVLAIIVQHLEVQKTKPASMV